MTPISVVWFRIPAHNNKDFFPAKAARICKMLILKGRILSGYYSQSKTFPIGMVLVLLLV